ncbi:efflux RND transporter periplasmic adaptor subunit [Microvirga alba]|uniref:Efflux RND transporter periplasmic adaptor subunit n=1 Tax=Microvirga alba TaxID=2791025 RepID=A0A931BR67_9HYPH|nr:efflux RND transporter periplasmic adaptor subunit [Microvirga alba]MBF9234174.1 efflux RND transporter periplasmic adaptor subunit [Microvirga alba]
MSLRLAFVFVLIGAVSALAQPAPKPAVSTVTVALQPITSGVTFNGRIAAIDKVDLRARVSGYLQDQAFKDGQDVKTGELLFTIEPDTYEAQVQQRKADLVAAQAKAENAREQLARAAELLPRQTISQATYDDRQADKRIADANVLQAQAALQQAEINLGFTKIMAPIEGRIGRAAFQRGALVGPDSGPLATIVSQDPIYALFPVSQRLMLEVRRRIEERGEKGFKAVVRLQLSDGSTYPQTGTIDFTDVTVDQSTDTLTIRAVFPNKQRILVDGQYVRVRVEDEIPEQAILIPQRALLNDQAGSYVFVVGPDSKVLTKRVQLGDSKGGDVVVTSGLEVGDRVVVDGIQKIRPGVEVDAAPVAPPPKG